MARSVHITEDELRFLERHESICHSTGRTFRDLGDAYLLTDPRDADVFWNRLAALRWPVAPAAFDRRLADALTLFGILDRRPHIWQSVDHDRPPDLVARLLDHGFADVGHGLILALVDRHALTAPLPEEDARGIAVARYRRPRRVRRVAEAAATVVGTAFGAEGTRIESLTDELATALRDERVTIVLASIDGVPAAVAKATTFDGATYLSSIGTIPAARGRGLGALVTREAAKAGLDSRWVYLGVFEANAVARRLYARLGFAQVGHPAADLLLP
jgi:GNAT superfamily N-acetyltransferase